MSDFSCIFAPVRDTYFVVNMRYLGSKDSIKGTILQLLQEKGLLRQGLTFFDAFCGMGSVSFAVKDYYNLVINDILRCCTTFTAAKLFGKNVQFDNIDFNPFHELNSDKAVEHGFFTTIIRLLIPTGCILLLKTQSA